LVEGLTGQSSYRRRIMYKRVGVFVAAMVLLVLVSTPFAVSEETSSERDSAFLARANLGFDVFGTGFAFGAGGGYRFGLGAGTAEVLVDVYYSPPFKDKWIDGIWHHEESSELLIVSARVDWLFLYSPGKTGFFPLVGAGFFAGSLWWEDIVLQDGVPGTGWIDSADYFASGTVLNLGAAWGFGKHIEARFEVPVMVFFGQYGTAAAVAIPLTLSVLYRF
jgi:hypothetical protein